MEVQWDVEVGSPEYVEGWFFHVRLGVYGDSFQFQDFTPSSTNSYFTRFNPMEGVASVASKVVDFLELIRDQLEEQSLEAYLQAVKDTYPNFSSFLEDELQDEEYFELWEPEDGTTTYGAGDGSLSRG